MTCLTGLTGNHSRLIRLLAAPLEHGRGRGEYTPVPRPKNMIAIAPGVNETIILLS